MAATAQDIRRQQVKAAIKRAAAQARADLVRYDQQILDELQAIYREARNDIERRILSAADAGGLLRLNVLRGLSDQLTDRIDQLGNMRDALLTGGLERAALIGANVASAGVGAATVAGFAEDAVRFVRSFVAEDGLQLSDRLWRLDIGAREGVMRALQSAIIQGHGASEAVQDFLRRGVEIPADLRQKLNMADSTRVARIAGDVLMTGENNPYDQAKQIFRTEINRAHGEAFRSAIFEVEGVIGTRFLLSPAHPRTDICDMHARANRYGLGPGVYPKGKSPWPAHPNTLSFEEPVFADEVTKENRDGKEGVLEWLKRQNQGTQANILNSEAKARALRAGVLTVGMVNAPWRVVKQQLTRRGVDVSGFVSTAVSAMPASSAISTGIPVSQAFNIFGKKRVVAEALESIDSVHGDGSLPLLPIRASRSKTFFGAYYHLGGRPVEIRIANSPWPLMTAAHEIGHFLDQQGIGKPGVFESALADSKLMAEWREAVNKSVAVRQLMELLNKPAVRTVGGKRYYTSKEYLDYLLRPHEMWARSYAQYIAVRSRNYSMLTELSSTLEMQRNAVLNVPTQWESSDFEAIMVAIDKIFDKLGWRDNG